MSKIYGYCRISTAQQKLERQITNIKTAFPDAIIFSEAYTGTKLNRPEWRKLYKRLQSGDTVIFDSVSRMSRTAADGFKLYKELSDKGIELVFLKERHIDTQAYKEAMSGIVSTQITSGDTATDELVNAIMQAVNKFMLAKVEADIFKAFEQSEKEVTDLHQRTKEGMKVAALQGHKAGRREGTTIETKKSIEMKELIKKYSKDFDGTLSDSDVLSIIKGSTEKGVSRNSYYKYKKELKESMQAE